MIQRVVLGALLVGVSSIGRAEFPPASAVSTAPSSAAPAAPAQPAAPSTKGPSGSWDDSVFKVGQPPADLPGYTQGQYDSWLSNCASFKEDGPKYRDCFAKQKKQAGAALNDSIDRTDRRRNLMNSGKAPAIQVPVAPDGEREGASYRDGEASPEND